MGARALSSMVVAVVVAAAAAIAQTPPTWAQQVAPLVHRSCTPCHRPGLPAPFVLLGHDDAQRRRKKIAEVVQLRLMPPWLPTHGDFADDRRLTPAEIATIVAWAEAGGPRGDAALEPAPPTFVDGWPAERPPDLVVRAEAALAVAANGPDVVRNLVIPVAVERLRHVEAVAIRPGSPAVHHAILGVDATRASRQLDAADAAPGFPGMTLGAAVPPDGHFLGWTPGKSVRRAPPGQAWRLRPGDDFVLQVHVVPTGKPEQVQPEVGLWFTDVPTRTTFVPVVLFSEAIDIAPGDADFVLRDWLDVPVPITVHALYPHAHRVCRRMRGTVRLPGGEERVLFAVDAWDFDWQDDYRLRTPLVLPAGSRLAIEYHYDNSAANPENPSRPPQRVRFGQASADEMGTLTLAVEVAPAQRAALAEAVVERQLAKAPDAWNLLLQHARLRRERGDLAAAGAALAKARTISPGAADVVVEQGLLAEVEGRRADARRCYEAALQLDPAHGLAHLQLGALLGRDGDGRAAFVHFTQAVAAMPNAALAQHNLATACFQLDRLAEAAAHYRRAVALDPEHFGAWLNLGRVLARSGDRAGARAALQQAAALRPDDAQVAAELASLGG